MIRCRAASWSLRQLLTSRLFRPKLQLTTGSSWINGLLCKMWQSASPETQVHVLKWEHRVYYHAGTTLVPSAAQTESRFLTCFREAAAEQTELVSKSSYLASLPLNKHLKHTGLQLRASCLKLLLSVHTAQEELQLYSEILNGLQFSQIYQLSQFWLIKGVILVIF